MQTACLELLVLLIGCGLCSVQNHYKAFKKFLKPVQILLLFVQDLLSSLRTKTKGKINWIKTFKPRIWASNWTHCTRVWYWQQSLECSIKGNHTSKNNMSTHQLFGTSSVSHSCRIVRFLGKHLFTLIGTKQSYCQ